MMFLCLPEWVKKNTFPILVNTIIPGILNLPQGLAGGFQYLLFLRLLGEMIQFDEHIFQMGGSTKAWLKSGCSFPSGPPFFVASLSGLLD